jgi:SynChlorMet cassette protein ScmA
MKVKKPYEAPKIIDLQVDYTQAVGVSKCLTGGQATGQCTTGGQATSQCTTGTQATVACSQGPSATPQNCRTGTTAQNCNYGKSP